MIFYKHEKSIRVCSTFEENGNEGSGDKERDGMSRLEGGIPLDGSDTGDAAEGLGQGAAGSTTCDPGSGRPRLAWEGEG